MINKRKALITCIDRQTYADPRYVSSQSLLDETQFLLAEFDFGRYRFTADSVPTFRNVLEG